jgi:hypothetical protein
MPKIISPYHLAQTYQTNGDLQPWARVQEYRRVHDYHTDHPEKGSHAVASALDLPRSRIRPWVDGDARPDAVHAIDTARDLGWLNVDVDTTDGRAWTRLVAWIHAGGSLSQDDYRPTFFARSDQNGSLAKPEVDVLTTALQTVGLDYRFKNRREQRPEDGSEFRATEIAPTEHRVLLGRCLASAGAPVGQKNGTHPEHLPAWLDKAGDDTQRAFARIYLLTRASVREHEPRFIIREERPDSFHRDLAQLLEDLAGADTVSRSGHNIHIHSTGADAILDG